MERMDIYMCRPLEGLRVPILVTTAAEDDGIPSEAEIDQAFRHLKMGIVGGPSPCVRMIKIGGCTRPISIRTWCGDGVG